MMPLVPAKIDAGWKFQRRKPARAPASAKQNIATYGSTGLAVRLMMPRVRAAINAMPDESPSRPSMKLMLLIMPTIQRKVTPAPIKPGVADDPLGVNGSLRLATATPGLIGAGVTFLWIVGMINSIN